MKRWLLVVCLLLIACGSASADRKRFAIGVNYGVFYPSSSGVRSAFGDSWTRFSIGPHDMKATEARWKRSFDLSFIRRERDGRVTLVPVTFGVERALSANQKAQPYVALRGGPFFGEAKSTRQGFNNKTFGINLNASIGINLDRRFFLEARYDYFTRFAQSRFDGLTLSAGIRLFEIKL
jgi:hypothetical protein